MRRKQLTLTIVGLICFIMIGLPCSEVYSGETTPPPPGTILPKFELMGLGSPETKAYLGIKDEKPFSLSQVKAKLVIVEFFDVF